jgi:NhaA family Na+:H+ antiporter
MLGASILGGVGFTMAIFVANLAYTDEVLIADAKLAILCASLVAGVIGFLFLLMQAKAAEAKGVAYISTQDVKENLPHDQLEAAIEGQEILHSNDSQIKDELKRARERHGVFEIAVDLGPSGLLGGGSITDVRDAIRSEVLRVLDAEGETELLKKLEREYAENKNEPPLEGIVEALKNEGDEARLQDALTRESDDATGL